MNAKQSALGGLIMLKPHESLENYFEDLEYEILMRLAKKSKNKQHVFINSFLFNKISNNCLGSTLRKF